MSSCVTGNRQRHQTVIYPFIFYHQPAKCQKPALLPLPLLLYEVELMHENEGTSTKWDYLNVLCYLCYKYLNSLNYEVWKEQKATNFYSHPREKHSYISPHRITPHKPGHKLRAVCVPQIHNSIASSCRWLQCGSATVHRGQSPDLLWKPPLLICSTACDWGKLAVTRVIWTCATG